MGRVVLFVISFSISILSIWFGDVIKNIFSAFVAKLIGNMILIAMGIFVCFQAIHKNEINTSIVKKDEKIYSFFIDFLGITIKIIKNPTSSDLDSSHSIDSKEALFLGVALSLDCFCMGVGGSMIGISPFLFPLFISVFQLFFLNMGNTLGKGLQQLSLLPDNTWSIISGILLIFIGIFRFIS